MEVGKKYLNEYIEMLEDLKASTYTDIQLLSYILKLYNNEDITFDDLKVLSSYIGYEPINNFLTLDFSQQLNMGFKKLSTIDESSSIEFKSNPSMVLDYEDIKLNSYPITIEVDMENTFSYAEYHIDSLLKVDNELSYSDYSFIKEVRIINNSADSFSDLIVKFSFGDDFICLDNIDLEKILGKQELDLRIRFLKVKKSFFASLSSPISEILNIEVLSKIDNKVLGKLNKYFYCLPYSQPSMFAVDDKRIYAKFVTPDSSRVKQVTINASNVLGRNIIGYQNGELYNEIVKECEAIYKALHNEAIVYQNPPANSLYFDPEDVSKGMAQRVRMPDEVLRDHKGTCLDLAILYCACLEEVGLHSILVFIEGHAFAGVFLDEEKIFDNCLEFNPSRLYNAANGLSKSILLVECTMFVADSTKSFQFSFDYALNNLKMYSGLFTAVDVSYCHRTVFTPLPISGTDEEIEVSIKPLKTLSEEFDPIINEKIINIDTTVEVDRFTFWEKKLLDLNELNPLVNLKVKPRNVVRIFSSFSIPSILDNNTKFNINLHELPMSRIDDVEASFYDNTLKPSKVFEVYDENSIYGIGLDKTLKTLIKKSNSAVEETGSPTLYLTLGLLTYNKKNGTKGQAPFMVLPVEIVKDKSFNIYNVKYDLDELMINQTFFEYYSLNHSDASFSYLYGSCEDYSYQEIVNYFKNKCDLDIQLDDNYFFIANLTFAHYIMWLDIKNRKEELKKNKIIDSIIKSTNLLTESIDENFNPNNVENYLDIAAPLSYDSTQLKAIIECALGKSFILDGPPGTGKSQTIVNMIVNAFYHGKTVLFVAEKKAALDVVADRLNKLKLSRFYLDLHSSNANKTYFFQKLKESMEIGPTRNPDYFDKVCAELEEKKNHLGLILSKIHEKKYYYSLYECIVLNEEYKNCEFNYELESSFVESLSNDKIDELKDLILQYESMCSQIDDFDSSSLKVLKIDYLNYTNKDEVIKEFNNLKTLLDEFLNGYNGLISLYQGFDFEYNQYIVKNVLDLHELLVNKTLYVDKIYKFYNIKDNDTNLLALNKAIELNNLVSRYSNQIDFNNIKRTSVLPFINDIKSSSFLTKSFKLSKYKKYLISNYNIVLEKIKLCDVLPLLEIIQKYYELANDIELNEDFILDLIDTSLLNKYKDANKILDGYNSTIEFVKVLNNLSVEFDFQKLVTYFCNVYKFNLSKISYMYPIVKESFIKYQETEKTICSKYNINYNIYDGLESALNEYKLFLDEITDESNFNNCILITKINQIENKIKEIGITDLIINIDKGFVSYKDTYNLFKNALANAYIKLYFADDDINYFSTKSFDCEIERYETLINEYNNLVIECVSAKLTKELNHNIIDYASSSPIGQLKKAISNNGRGVTIRNTLIKYDELIKKYFPCFLMSPLSAAQYLSVDSTEDFSSKFDIVIFDEASQIPTHEAIGPIARGNSLVVAGDPEQMPPTSFFVSNIEYDDNIEFIDADSLLDECLAINLPRIRLSYHYRSHHESLINFSNDVFYHNNLYTFPSSSAIDSMIKFKYVELAEEKKNTSISKDELSCLINTIKDIYSKEENKTRSIGIIVFNTKQQDKVYDVLNDELSKNRSLFNIMNEASIHTKEPWFVKSIENVQGDERDIIILMVGFRKNAIGKAIVNGPLITKNGSRRLNVAVSRSKEEMFVLSTIRSTDFEDDRRITNKGIKNLKHFLQYAESGVCLNRKESCDQDNSIISFIKDDLTKLGYDVVLNVGDSIFKVDIAIKDKSSSNYILGILVDSKPINNNISLRDKLYVQDVILNSLKWKVINIYSLDYYKNREETINRIVKAIDLPFVEKEYDIDPNIIKECKIDKVYKTKSLIIPKSYTKVRYYSDKGFTSNFTQLINEILDSEAPVSFDRIKQIIRENSNLSSIQPQVAQKIKNKLRKLEIMYTLDQDDIEFYWKSELTTMDYFRVATPKDLYDIPKEEIINVFTQIYHVQGMVSKEDLFRQTLKLLPLTSSVLNKRNMLRLDYCYDYAINNGIINK